MPSCIQLGFRRARPIAGIMTPTRSMITRNNAILQPHVTGAIAVIATPNPIMQIRTTASLPRLTRACSCNPESSRWRVCDSVLISVIPSVLLNRDDRNAHHGRL